MKEIADWFLRKVITSKYFNSRNGVRDTGILFPPFFKKVQAGVKKFNEKYPEVKIIFVETYRSNDRQLMHYNNGASKIRKDGMHHFAIAVDCAGEVRGKFTYDIDYRHLRECMKEQGLTLLGLWDAGHFQYIRVSEQNALRRACYDAVRDFQRKQGLAVDGIPGPKTIARAKEVFGDGGSAAGLSEDANDGTNLHGGEGGKPDGFPGGKAINGKNRNRGKAKPD